MEACAAEYPDYGDEFGACLDEALEIELAQESSSSGDESSSLELESSSLESSALSLAQETSDSEGESSSADESSADESSELSLAQETSDSGDESSSADESSADESSALSLAQESDHTSGSGISVDSSDLEGIDSELEELTLAQEDSAYGDEEDEFSIGTTTEAELAECDEYLYAEDYTAWEACLDDVFGVVPEFDDVTVDDVTVDDVTV